MIITRSKTPCCKCLHWSQTRLTEWDFLKKGYIPISHSAWVISHSSHGKSVIAMLDKFRNGFHLYTVVFVKTISLLILITNQKGFEEHSIRHTYQVVSGMMLHCGS